MTNFAIYAIAGEYAIDMESGQQLYDQIYPRLLAGEPVTLNFTGVKVFASAFFNVAIAQLLKDLTAEELNQRLTIEHLSEDGYAVLKHSIAKARAYYSDPDYREAVDTVMEEYAANC